MTTLTDFLLARIAEDEAAANEREFEHPSSQSPSLAHPDFGPIGDDIHAPDDFINFYLGVSPARVLAECAAKRRIIARHEEDEEGGGLHVCHDELADDSECVELRALAGIYADHPDFRSEWVL